jgi:hypothetical protein
MYATYDDPRGGKELMENPSSDPVDLIQSTKINRANDSEESDEFEMPNSMPSDEDNNTNNNHTNNNLNLLNTG